MISSALLGLAGGFVLSIPPGPLSIAVTRHALGNRFRAGFFMVIAAALMDIVYMLISAFASSAIVTTLSALITESTWFPLVFQVICMGVLGYLGVSYLNPENCSKNTTKNEQQEQRQEARAQTMGRTSPFFVGLLIAVTNLASPTFLPSMIAFVGFLHAQRWLGGAFGDNVGFAVGFGVGTTIWFFIVLRTLVHFRTKLPDSLITGIYRFAGGTMILFALVIAYHAATTTAWGALFS